MNLKEFYDSMKNKIYLSATFGVFALFVIVLLYSYIYKLGYLPKAREFFFGAVIVAAAINIYKNPVFWSFITAGFAYVYLDKMYKLHIILAQIYVFTINITPFNPVIIINIIYLAIFMFMMIIFRNYLLKEFIEGKAWLYLFVFAVMLKAVAILTDFLFSDITEDYFELFSLYFFTSSFLLEFISSWRDREDESRNISS